MFRLSRPVSPPLENAPNNGGDLYQSSCRQQTALVRSGRKLSQYHPGIVLPPRLEEQSIHEQLRRCCDRMQSYPKAVDTLYRSLSTIINHPHEPTFRRIDTTSPGYQRALANVPGAEQLFRTLGFAATNNAQALVLTSLNPDNFRLALEMLEQTKESAAYQVAKRKEAFVRQVRKLLETEITHEEQSKRKDLLSQVPREPGPGRAAVMIVQLLPSSHPSEGAVLTRRFDGDDTLEDVLHWLGGTAGSAFYHNIVHSQEFCLVDVNRAGPVVPLDCAHTHKTLQHLGFWPSGRLSLQLPEAHGRNNLRAHQP